jgi:hypothetical protein
MKTFSDDALAALQRGDAIVSASVEIIPVSSRVPDLIAEGTTAEVGWYQNTFVQTGGNDEARMGVAFLDIDGVQIGSPTWSTYTQPTTWTARTVSANAPASCYGVRVYQDHLRLAGTNNDGFIDDITMTLGGVAVDLINPGAEQGTTGWTSTVGALATRSANPDPHTGSAYFFGGSGFVQTTAYQDYATFTSAADGDPIRLWGGYGAMDLPSDEGTSTFLGIGDRGLVNQSVASIGGSAQNLTLALSGIEPAALEVLDPDEVKGASVVVRRLIFDGAGKTLLGAYVYTRGRVDELKTSEVIGGPATIELSVEGAARGLGRRGGRLRSDADQRLVSSTDGFYRVVSAAPKKTLYWGGKKPSTAGSSLGSGGTSAPSSSTSKSVAV